MDSYPSDIIQGLSTNQTLVAGARLGKLGLGLDDELIEEYFALGAVLQ